MSNKYVGPLRDKHGPMPDSYFNTVDEDDIWNLFRYELLDCSQNFNSARSTNSPVCVWLIATGDDISHK